LNISISNQIYQYGWIGSLNVIRNGTTY